MIVALIAISIGVVVADDDPQSDKETTETARGDDAESTEGQARRVGWTQLPDPPLSPRTGASAAWTGQEVIVAGGWDFLCGPAADCGPPEEPPFTDGAAYEPTAGTWRSIADAPVAFHDTRPAVVGGQVFYLVDCTVPGFAPSDVSPSNQRCPGTDDSVVLLRYDPVGDAWTQFPGLEDGRFYELETVGSSLVAYSTSDEGDELPDWRFDVATETWSELPDDPLPPVFDRSIVAADGGDTVLLFGAPIGSEAEPAEESNVAARLDLTTMTWSELPASPSRGYRAWGVDGQAVLEPHFGGTGGLFDPETNTWTPLPSPTAESLDTNTVAGTLGRDGAVYAAAAGWLFDAESERWLEVEPLDDSGNSWTTTVAAVDRDLFIYGGESWTSSEGELLGEAWLWRAPAPGGA